MNRTSAPARLPAARLLVLATLAGLAPAAWGEAKADPTTSVTIYSSSEPGAISADLYRPRVGQQWDYAYNQQIPGYAFVREDRPIRLGAGKTTLRITDVAALIEPTTVSFKSLTDPDGTRVGEQNFQFDLVSNQKLLEKFIDKPIAVDVTRGDKAETVHGTLMSAAGGLILKKDDGTIDVINGYTSLNLPSLPDGLITRPTLVWDVYSDKGGDQTARISYQTDGITWWADYNLVYTDTDNANKGTLDVSAWVSILNKSGGSYRDARLKLVAGQVQRTQPQNRAFDSMARSELMAGAAAAPAFQEKSFFEYHLYTLDTPATIPDNTTKQLELFPTARSVPADKVLLYAGQGDDWWYGGEPMTDQNYGVQSKSDVDVYLRFENNKKSGLGIPLPAGRIRVSKLDSADGNMEFIGEDAIKHTPRDEEVLIRLGKAFDVVGSRRQVEFSVDSVRRTMTETIEVEVRNRKDQAAEVVVQERMLRWANWQFVGKDTPTYKKLDARTVHFPVQLAANETRKVTFTVKYSW